MENAVLLFFEKEVSECCEKAREEGREAGRQAGIRKIIYNNLQAKYGVDSVSERLWERIDAINYYPALEEIQLAAWRTPTLDAFERKITEIVTRYKDEIQAPRH